MRGTEFIFSETAYRTVRILARKFANKNFPEEDLYQEGLLAYIRANSTFDPARGVSMETYASRVIRNRFIDLLRHEQEIPSSLDEDQAGDFSLDDEVNLSNIRGVLSKHVGDIERAIFNAYIEGLSYDEIGKIFETNRKKIDNTVQKVKRIIKSFM